MIPKQIAKFCGQRNAHTTPMQCNAMQRKAKYEWRRLISDMKHETWKKRKQDEDNNRLAKANDAVVARLSDRKLSATSHCSSYVSMVFIWNNKWQL